MTSRRQVADALLKLIDGVYQWNQKPSRRLMMWADVDASLRPCAFLRKPHEGFKKQSPTVPVVRTLEFMLYVYVNAKPVDQGSTAGADQIDDILDALESALQPSGPGVSDNRQTLGGIVFHCWIEGDVPIDAGDLDGDGVTLVPIRVMMP